MNTLFILALETFKNMSYNEFRKSEFNPLNFFKALIIIENFSDSLKGKEKLIEEVK
jgi:hypothetical protein